MKEEEGSGKRLWDPWGRGSIRTESAGHRGKGKKSVRTEEKSGLIF